MAVVSGSSALLLRDTYGDKGGSWFPSLRKKKDQPVLRGSLLRPIAMKDSGSTADGKPAYNYKVYNEEIIFYCSEQEVAPLTEYEFNLLCGIKQPSVRYATFVDENDIVDWGVKLRMNDKVYVSLPTKQAIETTWCQAVVRWIGVLPGEEGTKFGVEIIVSKHTVG